MKTEKVKNKEGEILTTEEGIELENHTFEVGDEFIPIHNNIMEKRRTVEVKGKEKVITNYKVKAKVKGYDDEYFISLTPTQAKSLKNKIDNGLELNQNIFICYEYVNDYGPQVGIGLKREEKEPIDFE